MIQEQRLTAVIALQHHIAGHSHGAYQPHAETVLRNKGHMNSGVADHTGILADDLHGRTLSVLGIVILHTSAALHRLQSRDGLQKFLLSIARHPGDSQDLSAEGIEIDVT